MNTADEHFKAETASSKPAYAADAFSRLDDSDDSIFYKTDRFVSHLDAFARSTVEGLIGELIIEKKPFILDLMAGWDSHIPEKIKPAGVVGLGLNENELNRNPVLTETVIHDINKDPRLPFPRDTFDVVINTVSVDYMTQPLAVFSEVARILKPGGLFLVVFSNRMFPQKAVKIWRDADDDERIILVEEFFKESGQFEKPELFISRGKPRPKSDKYAALGIPSDPVYAWYAEKSGNGRLKKKRPIFTVRCGDRSNDKEIDRKKKDVGKTLSCPHCGEKLKKWEVPDNPFCQTWDNAFMYICFNDECPYYVRGWDLMYKSTNKTISYRFMYNPEKDTCMPIPVPSPRALKEGIME